jgi:hypothetical protein
MKRSTSMCAGLAAGLLLFGSKSQAESSPAEECLTQCKASVEECIRAAGDDPDQIQQCSAQAMQCIESCKGG